MSAADGDLTPGSGAPRLLVWTAALVCLVGTAMALLGAWRIGVTTDETFHVFRLQMWLDCGWYLLPDDMVGCRPGEWVPDAHVYAPAATLLMHGVNVLLGHDGPGTVSTTWEAYQVRHLVTAGIGLSGVAATGLVTRLLTGRWTWGVVSMAALFALAPYAGSIMFNPKDVPVAVGWTLLTAGLVLGLRRDPGRRALSAATTALVAAGLVLSVGTRPGVWPGVGTSGLAMLLIAWWCYGRAAQGTGLGRRVAEVLAGVVVAAVVLVAIYPALFAHPLEWLLGSVGDSSSYHGVSGHRMYVPAQFVLYTPVLLLAFLLVGLGRAWLGLAKVREARLTPFAGGVLLVVVQAALLPLMAVLLGSYLYHGLRQLMFLYPALAVLATLEMRRLASRPQGTPAGRRAVAVVGAAALLVPVAAQAQLFPYGYAYASELTDLTGGETGGEYWRAGFRELAPRLPEDEFVQCTPATPDGISYRYNGEAGRSMAEASRDCRTDPVTLLTVYREWDVDERAPVADEFIGLFPPYIAPGENCRIVDTVTRPRHWTTQVMALMARCSLRLPPYPDEGIDLTPTAGGYRYLLGGWTSRQDWVGSGLLGTQGSLGFTSPSLAADGGRLVLDLRGELDQVLVNNRELPFRAGGRRVVVDVPPGVAGAFGQDRLVVTVRSDDPGMRLVAVEARRSVS